MIDNPILWRATATAQRHIEGFFYALSITTLRSPFVTIIALTGNYRLTQRNGDRFFVTLI